MRNTIGMFCVAFALLVLCGAVSVRAADPLCRVPDFRPAQQTYSYEACHHCAYPTCPTCGACPSCCKCAYRHRACTPDVSSYWSYSRPEYTCQPNYGFYFTYGTNPWTGQDVIGAAGFYGENLFQPPAGWNANDWYFWGWQR